ncbi:ribosome biogenesis GTP-binding protein YihA/YsxC [Gallaecimonas pentaromativorans]|uniref:Probable GTP-binding protein EngB n=1 Tax=Gallaecimonas pentaromativorans TaxID=584787 RepID=A0A3N1PI82_9GAMM|nr:ribosome biogenesis GTP-binding protein YihA/YsxC [Gallaecimonas pentaromativorans]MED5525303.1 ribosome biogenesis GTP-binding protein YihA/YsxC [Pseudomonadota bacterium]ROQ24266.1 cell division checkpoint GTPase YihA [Gallaecimonas pentaromativorans]
MNPIPEIDFRQARFITSAPDIRHLPRNEGVEIAFAGRSNAGKSSALNAITGQKQLARTSKTPGRTQLINLFSLADPRHCLVDLPGYGFAKVPLEMKEKWQASLTEYLEKRESLCGLVVLMDIRHPFKDIDQDLIFWAVESGLPVLAILTKADKLKSGARKATVLQCKEAALAFGGDVTVMALSVLKGLGITEVRRHLAGWLSQVDADPEAEDEPQHEE